MKGRTFTAMAALATTTSCAVFDPYVREPKQDTVTEARCLGIYGENDAALQYACATARSIEKARSAIVRTQSGAVATLAPLVGVVSSNVARNHNAATTTALTAGGLAGYTVVGTLAQSDRVRAYDEGLKSISCSMNVYIKTKAESGANLMGAVDARILVEEALSLADKAKVGATPEVQKRIDAAVDSLQALRMAISYRTGTGYLEAQLVTSVRDAVAGVNGQLANTLPNPNTALAGLVGGLTNAGLKKPSTEPSGIKRLADLNTLPAMPGPGDEDRTKFWAAAVASEQAYKNLMSLPPLKGEFKLCAFNLAIPAAYQGLAGPMMLGAGDYANGTTISMQADSTYTIRIFGGLPPFDAKIVSGDSKHLTATVDTGTGGTAFLKLVTSPTAPAATEQKVFQVVVTDVIGQQFKSVKVEL